MHSSPPRFIARLLFALLAGVFGHAFAVENTNTVESATRLGLARVKQAALEGERVGFPVDKAWLKFQADTSLKYFEERIEDMDESAEHPRYGSRRIAALLRGEGGKVGQRHLHRLRRTAGLRVPPSQRRVVRRGVSTGLPTKATHRGHVWTWDFIADATMRGGALRMLPILDEHTREGHVLGADRALRSEDVLAWFEKGH